ncbi:AraC family transcriptional regulator [Burkholderia thailandensis]|nr:AraC family transcriptional regulator [Burkholderia thailandensis]
MHMSEAIKRMAKDGINFTNIQQNDRSDSRQAVLRSAPPLLPIWCF